MDKGVLQRTRVAVLWLAPAVFVFRLMRTGHLNYGKGHVTWSDLFVLLYGLCCLAVSACLLYEVGQLWKNNNDDWEKELKRTFKYILLFAGLLVPTAGLVRDYDGNFGFLLTLFSGVIFGFVPFLFCVGIVLLILGLCGLSHMKRCGSSFPAGLLAISVILLFIGFFPAMMVLAFYADGGVKIFAP